MEECMHRVSSVTVAIPSNLAIPSASFLKGAREEKLAQSDLKQNQCINYYYLSDLAICDSLPLSHLLFP